MTRKVTSLFTLGLVSYRTDSERQAKFARQTRNAVRAQVAQGGVGLGLQRDQIAQATSHHVDHLMRDATAPPPPPAAIPAGWYADGSVQRWWDGRQWTPHTR